MVGSQTVEAETIGGALYAATSIVFDTTTVTWESVIRNAYECFATRLSVPDDVINWCGTYGVFSSFPSDLHCTIFCKLAKTGLELQHFYEMP